MSLPPDVQALIDTLLPRLEQILGDDLVGVYLRGSLALGDFIPATSDLDLLAVTERPIGADEFAALAAMHAEIDTLPLRFARRVEMVYLDRDSVRRFRPGQRHATLGQGEALRWTEHGTNWIIERWTVREHGMTLRGPDPRTLIDPVTPNELRTAVRERLPDWGEWADAIDDPDWQLPRSHKAYVVETMCRALYTIAHSTIPSKAQAVEWALASFAEPWRSTVKRSQRWRTDQTFDPEAVEEARRFLRWAVATGTSGDIPGNGT